MLRILLRKKLIITRKRGRKLRISYRFSIFPDCTRVYAVHISTKHSFDLQEHGKNMQKMRFDAITGLKTGFRSKVRVNPLLSLVWPRATLFPFPSSLLAKLANSQIASRKCYCFDFGFTATADA